MLVGGGSRVYVLEIVLEEVRTIVSDGVCASETVLVA